MNAFTILAELTEIPKTLGEICDAPLLRPHGQVTVSRALRTLVGANQVTETKGADGIVRWAKAL
jgi:hypothetical protein